MITTDAGILLVTTHRRENLGEPMRDIYRALRDVVLDYPDVEVVFPVHKKSGRAQRGG